LTSKLELIDQKTLITDVQDNSILVEKDTGKRYWRTPESTSETESTGTYAVDLPVGSYDNDKQGFCVANTSSVVYGKTISSVSFWLKRGSSTSGTAYIRVWSGTGNGNAGTQVHEFGSIALSALTTSFVKHTFSTGSHTLAVNDTVGVEYAGGSSSTSPVLQGATTDVYDGVNTIRNRNTVSGTFSPVSSHDVKFAITETTPAAWNPTPELAYTGSSVTDSTVGGYRYLEFLSSGTITIEGYTPDILIVNGGNAGSGQNGGAGGQIRQITGQTGLSGTYTITIGGSSTASVFTGESGYSTTAGANGGIGQYTYSGGAGGAGTSIASFPATWDYSGGGGGGAGQQNNNTYGGAGGSGGGGGGGKGRKGNFGYGAGGGRNNGQNGSSYKHGGAGGANTGGGGGGGGRYQGVGTAGAGGTGVFVLRIPV
jgi:hypothetical protein